MKISDAVRKCVTFIGCKDVEGKLHLQGTAVLIGDPTIDPDGTLACFVTARHVIEGIRDKHAVEDIWIRINTKGGDIAMIQTKLSEWHFHPTDDLVDVAVHFADLPSNADHLIFPVSLLRTHSQFEAEDISVGDDVFIAGLFKHHSGTQRNIPIIRTGTIAALDQEQVNTKAGPRDAFLIEARSIGGLSGSPVFAHLGIVRVKNGQFQYATSPSGTHLLIGIVHGHWDNKSADVDGDVEDSTISIEEKINVGIAIITPVEKIVETFDQPSMLAVMKKRKFNKPQQGHVS